jgi:preprotein translocase subunit YajC
MQFLTALVALQDQTDNKQPQGFGDPTFLVLMAAIFVAFYFIIIMPMKRREKKERDDLFSKLKKNDEVLTASGIIGIVAMVKDDEVVLKVDESSNVRLRVLKSSIARILNPKETKESSEAKAPKPEGKDSPS